MLNLASADPAEIPAIVLAAGGSLRLGRPKQLLCVHETGGETLLGRAVRLAQDAGAAPVFVVLGAHSEEIQRNVPLPAGTVLLNSEWQEGMASSLRLGIRAVMESCPSASGALMMVCDQPALSAEHLRKLLAVHSDAPETFAASHYAGRYGVPVVLPRTWFAATLTLTGDQGARAILLQAAEVHAVEFLRGEWDIDRPEDWQRS